MHDYSCSHWRVNQHFKGKKLPVCSWIFPDCCCRSGVDKSVLWYATLWKCWPILHSFTCTYRCVNFWKKICTSALILHVQKAPFGLNSTEKNSRENKSFSCSYFFLFSLYFFFRQSLSILVKFALGQIFIGSMISFLFICLQSIGL